MLRIALTFTILLLSFVSSSSSITLPSERLNLSVWKITLPYGSPATEVKQPALDGFTDPRYFHLNDDQSAVIFMAPTNGTTTSGSRFPRSGNHYLSPILSASIIQL